jgi:hypothetical protein
MRTNQPRVVKILSRTFRPVKQAVWNPTNRQILNRIDPTSGTGLRRGTIGDLSSVPNGEFPASKSSLVRARPSKVRGSRHPIALRVVLSNSERPLARPAKVDRRPKTVRELLVQVCKPCKIWTVGGEGSLHASHRNMFPGKHLRA